LSLITFATLTLLQATAPSSAETPAAPAEPAISATAANHAGLSREAAHNPVAQGDPNKVICKTEQMTGSRLSGSRVCLTVAQWEERSRQNSEVLSNSQTRSLQSGFPQ